MSISNFQPSTFILPSGLALPPGAEPDYAFTASMPFPAVNSTTAFTYMTGAGYYDLIIGVIVTIVTNSTAGNRVVTLEALDQNGNGLYSIPATQVVPASTTSDFTWSLNLSVAYAVTAASGSLTQVAPIPPILLLPGYTLEVVVDGPSSTDRFITRGVTVIHIPTGPIAGDPTSSLVATPLVL